MTHIDEQERRRAKPRAVWVAWCAKCGHAEYVHRERDAAKQAADDGGCYDCGPKAELRFGRYVVSAMVRR